MTIEKLFKLHTLLGEIKSNDWNIVMEIVGCPAADIKGHFDEIKIIDKVWNDNYKSKNPEYYPLDLSNLTTWSTFSHTCIDLTFTIVKNRLHCHARIFDGNNFNGSRQNLRFTANLLMPNKFIKVLKNNILTSFEYYLEDQYEIYLETQKNNWITNFKNKIYENI